MIQLTVRGMSQDIDFETGGQTNFIMLQLPGGKVFRAAVEDEVAQMLMNVAAGMPSDAQVASPIEYASQPSPMSDEDRQQIATAMEQSGQMQMSEDQDGEAVLDFGGGGMPAAADLQKMSIEEIEKLPQEMVMRGKTISSGVLDDMGNMRSIPGGGVDAGEVVGDDDDGTDQI